jgi:hypothetical protein
VVGFLLAGIMGWMALIIVLHRVFAAPPAFLVLAPGGILALVVTMIVYLNLPGRLHIGADGLLIDSRDATRFVRFAEIRAVEKYRQMIMGKQIIGVALQLVAGDTVQIPMGEDQFGADRRVHALYMDIEAALEDYGKRAPGADLAALARGDRSTEAWLQRLRAVGTGANAGPREAPVTQERLWRVVEDPTLEPEARAAAAAALVPSLDDEGKTRLRVAAEATAAPKLRVAFESAASADEAAIATALEAMEKR